ncbi:hypothetical protein [Nocardioides massiliensis]|uniref:Uncharacterized protein n=1 Tax=Nocardioides massiliensis TaxID=1325935 RepID=A0ABT9NQR3_9ACTN|nr:hypothetical protein [Nocardioides massiliensis]MDP9822771.1 hypothetical protein [Nocardioides massiliensis]
MPENRNGRPTPAKVKRRNVSDGDLDFSSLGEALRRTEQIRRARLVRDLHRVADRLARHDAGASALARAWAEEVAA